METETEKNNNKEQQEGQHPLTGQRTLPI